MKPLFFSLCLAGLGGLVTGGVAGAQNPGGFAGQSNLGYPFVPFGFYQPYGAQYGTTISTPPYFALNPPVYYGTRYARPYGLSPFAAPPMMDAPASYRGQIAPAFVRPPVSNPYIESCAGGCAKSAPADEAKVVVKKVGPIQIGPVQNNPFVTDQNQVAQR
jgi:hypothetical protein